MSRKKVFSIFHTLINIILFVLVIGGFIIVVTNLTEGKYLISLLYLILIVFQFVFFIFLKLAIEICECEIEGLNERISKYENKENDK